MRGRLRFGWNLAAATIVVACAASSLRAQQELPGLDPSIKAVVSGGYWESGGQRRTIRLVVVSGGPDHIVSTLYVQWLEDPTEENGTTVVRSTSVDEVSGVVSIGEPRLVRAGKQWRATVTGTD